MFDWLEIYGFSDQFKIQVDETQLFEPTKETIEIKYWNNLE